MRELHVHFAAMEDSWSIPVRRRQSFLVQRLPLELPLPKRFNGAVAPRELVLGMRRKVLDRISV